MLPNRHKDSDEGSPSSKEAKHQFEQRQKHQQEIRQEEIQLLEEKFTEEYVTSSLGEEKTSTCLPISRIVFLANHPEVKKELPEETKNSIRDWCLYHYAELSLEEREITHQWVQEYLKNERDPESVYLCAFKYILARLLNNQKLEDDTISYLTRLGTEKSYDPLIYAARDSLKYLESVLACRLFSVEKREAVKSLFLLSYSVDTRWHAENYQHPEPDKIKQELQNLFPLSNQLSIKVFFPVFARYAIHCTSDYLLKFKNNEFIKEIFDWIVVFDQLNTVEQHNVLNESKADIYTKIAFLGNSDQPHFQKIKIYYCHLMEIKTNVDHCSDIDTLAGIAQQSFSKLFKPELIDALQKSTRGKWALGYLYFHQWRISKEVKDLKSSVAYFKSTLGNPPDYHGLQLLLNLERVLRNIPSPSDELVAIQRELYPLWAESIIHFGIAEEKEFIQTQKQKETQTSGTSTPDFILEKQARRTMADSIHTLFRSTPKGRITADPRQVAAQALQPSGK